MKKLYLLLFSICILASCSQEIEQTPSGKKSITDLVSVVNIPSSTNTTRGSVGNTCLSFNDVSDYNAFVALLKEKTTGNRQTILQSLGFKNLLMIANEADKELEEIGAKAQSEDEFRMLYSNYVAKYKGILVRNSQDKNDLTLYIPASSDEDIDPYIAGAAHSVVINDIMKNLDFTDELNSVDSKLFASQEPSVTSVAKDYKSEEDWPINKFTQTQNGKKTVFQCSLENEKVKFYFSGQKKMWYGWKRDDDRSYFFRLYNMVGMTESLPLTLRKTNYTTNTYYFGAVDDFITFGKGEFQVGVATKLGMPSLNEYEVTGKIYVWTDKMSDKDADGNTIYQKTTLPGGAIVQTHFPQFTNDNGYPCKINLVKTI